MELRILDPFGDYETAGYLRNVYGVKDLEIVGHLETGVFQQEILGTVRFLRRLPNLQYDHVTETHRQLFSSLYPWAGQDRSVTAPESQSPRVGITSCLPTLPTADGLRNRTEPWARREISSRLPWRDLRISRSLASIS